MLVRTSDSQEPVVARRGNLPPALQTDTLDALGSTTGQHDFERGRVTFVFDADGRMTAGPVDWPAKVEKWGGVPLFR